MILLVISQRRVDSSVELKRGHPGVGGRSQVGARSNSILERADWAPKLTFNDTKLPQKGASQRDPDAFLID